MMKSQRNIILSNSLGSSYTTVVAIDFGTTYSGYAFCFNDGTGKSGVYMNRDWGDAHGGKTTKTPTTLLLAPNGEFKSFGYEADEMYTELKEDQKRYYYFKHFKMELHKSQVGQLKVTLSLSLIRPCSSLSVEGQMVSKGLIPMGRSLDPPPPLPCFVR